MRHVPLFRHAVLSMSLFASLAGSALTASAESLRLMVVDQKGAPLPDAVAYAEPVHGAVPPAVKGNEILIDQIKRHFVPMVSVARTGTSVRFPNKDNFEHDVYSFSPAKTFRLNLYHGEAAKPVLFDKSGLVVMGCSIHDTMLAYLLLVDTPYFAKSDATGALVIDKLPADQYKVTVWHYQAANQSPTPTVMAAGAAGAAPVRVALTLKAD